MSNNLLSRVKTIFILFVDFVGLLIIVAILLIVLNYFKVIPLSKNFPKYFGFLPQIIQKTAVTTPTPKPIVSALAWDKEATPALVSNYSDYFKKQNTPAVFYEKTIDMYFVNGAFTAYNKNYIQTVTPEGPTVFQINNDTIFRKISPPITSKNDEGDGTLRVTEIYKSSTDFFNNVLFGNYLRIMYKLNGDMKVANSIDYYPEYQY